ncbi:MAG: cellulase family glycosylhydrolase [Opitutaceae bacterium]|nr:cellulase family glycosylhydrolase [Opitutaceae bacterium]
MTLLVRRCRSAAVVLLVAASAAGTTSLLAAAEPFVRVSPRDSRYFELTDGRPFVPIGLNVIAPPVPEEAEGLARMDEWMQHLAANGGNFIRVWLSSPFWDVEHERSGTYDETKARRTDALLQLAQKHGLKVKLTLEHFREMNENPRQRWANKPIHLRANGGPAEGMADFFGGETSRAQFRQKLAWFAARYREHPEIFGWELWNEVNAVTTKPEYFMPWTQLMLAELRRLMPHHLAMQSLGSYDRAAARMLYREHSLMPGNDVAQVHRYLDLGASLPICHAPMDVLTSDAVRDLITFDPRRPVLLAESGAVEPKHTGPFKLYARDTEGMLLHDVLFAPFFSGAAGSGQIWHWDVYVARNRLWHHFARFAAAVRGIDPPAENFQPVQLHQPRLRVYALKGERTILVWCRDPANTWQTELEQGIAPARLSGMTLGLQPLLGTTASTRVDVYDPWRNEWSQQQAAAGKVPLPAFSRSIVVRIERGIAAKPDRR